MKTTFYVLGSIALVIVAGTFLIFWVGVIALGQSTALRDQLTGRQTSIRVVPGRQKGEVVAKTAMPNKVSIEHVTQIGDGDAIAFAYATVETDTGSGYGYYGNNYNVVDQRAGSLQCEQALGDDDDPLGPDACRLYPTFNTYFPTVDKERDERLARNVFLIRTDGTTQQLFSEPVRIFHSEILLGRSSDYAAIAYLDADTDKDGVFAHRDLQKLAVFNLKARKLLTIALPRGFLNLGSVIGRNDQFNVLVAKDIDANGRFDPVVEPMEVYKVNFANGEAKPAIEPEVLEHLQQQLDATATTAKQ